MPFGWDQAIALGTGLANLFGQGKQRQHEKALNERTIQAQQQLAEYQYSKDLEQWERANVYNAPTQQMERLRQAGLNPRLVYGSSSGGVAGTAAQTMPKYQAPRPEYQYSMGFDPRGLLQEYMNFRQQNAQINLLKEEQRIRANEANIKDWWANRQPFWRQTGPTSMVVDKTPPFQLLGRTQIQAAEEGVRQKQRQIQNIESQIALRDKQNEWYLYQLFGNMGLSAAKEIGRLSLGRGKKVAPLQRDYKKPIRDWKRLGY